MCYYLNDDDNICEILDMFINGYHFFFSNQSLLQITNHQQGLQENFISK